MLLRDRQRLRKACIVGSIYATILIASLSLTIYSFYTLTHDLSAALEVCEKYCSRCVSALFPILSGMICPDRCLSFYGSPNGQCYGRLDEEERQQVVVDDEPSDAAKLETWRRDKLVGLHSILARLRDASNALIDTIAAKNRATLWQLFRVKVNQTRYEKRLDEIGEADDDDDDDDDDGGGGSGDDDETVNDGDLREMLEFAYENETEMQKQLSDRYVDRNLTEILNAYAKYYARAERLIELTNGTDKILPSATFRS